MQSSPRAAIHRSRFQTACLRAFALALAMAWVAPLVAEPQDGRRVFRFVYEVAETPFPAGSEVDLYLPLPRNLPGQTVLEESLVSSPPGKRGSETVHGNAYLHIHRPAGSDAPVRARLEWTVARFALGAYADSPEEAELERYLAPNARVPVGHEVLDPILAEIRAMRRDDSREATARAIYDWVVDNLEYRKVGTGWGNGDTFWACSERYGNCTDFHALFISLARTEGIPARFEIGFPVPLERSAGEVGGYHCWVQFYLPGSGWVPIDASEASRHPDRRESFYGAYPADRIQFSTGRDLVLSTASARQPLNYFIYPYVEVDGEPWQGRVGTRFSYREIAPALARRR